MEPLIQVGDYIRLAGSTNSRVLRVTSVWPASNKYEGVCAGSLDASEVGCDNLFYIDVGYANLFYEKVINVGGVWKPVNKVKSAFIPAPQGLTALVSPPYQRIPNECPPAAGRDYSLTGALEARAAAAQEALKESRKADAEARKAKRKAEAKAVREKAAQDAKVAFMDRLADDAGLAAATSDLIAEVQRLLLGNKEEIAGSGITKHADKLDALAHSYGYKLVRAGTRVIVTKA